jgi:hypothetical protein
LLPPRTSSASCPTLRPRSRTPRLATVVSTLWVL